MSLTMNVNVQQIASFLYALFTLLFIYSVNLGDTCIQKFHLGTYIVGYTVGNLVLRRRASGAVKRDF